MCLCANVASIADSRSGINFILAGLHAGRAGFCRVPNTRRCSTVSSTRKRMRRLGCGSAFPLLLGISGQPACFVSLGSTTKLIGVCTFISIGRCRVMNAKGSIRTTEGSCVSGLGARGVRDRRVGPSAMGNIVRGVGSTMVSNGAVCCVGLVRGSAICATGIAISSLLPFARGNRDIILALDNGSIAGVRCG